MAETEARVLRAKSSVYFTESRVFFSETTVAESETTVAEVETTVDFGETTVAVNVAAVPGVVGDGFTAPRRVFAGILGRNESSGGISANLVPVLDEAISGWSQGPPFGDAEEFTTVRNL